MDYEHFVITVRLLRMGEGDSSMTSFTEHDMDEPSTR
jgi:hypothetical protein